MAPDDVSLGTDQEEPVVRISIAEVVLEPDVLSFSPDTEGFPGIPRSNARDGAGLL